MTTSIRLGLCSVVSVTVMSLTVASAWPANVNDFVDFSRPGLPGRLFTPPEATAGDRPLVLFLHGAGESGSNNVSQVNGNIDNLLNEAKRRGAYLYAPQTNQGWGSTTITGRVAEMVDRALDEFNVASDRLYVTGLSMGGGGTWNMLNRYPQQYAAGVPIAGISPNFFDFQPGNFLEQAVWAFHARNDGVVPVTRTRTVVQQIASEAGSGIIGFPPNNSSATFFYGDPHLDLSYTEWPSGGHGIWGRVYSTPAMYEWLFSHSTIPEPSTLTLWTLACCFGFTTRWTRRN